MKENELAEFTVRILSANNAAWQASAESDVGTFALPREMQLWKGPCKKHPGLMPVIGPVPIKSEQGGMKHEKADQ